VLVGVKLLHTVIWFFFVACIVGIPVAGFLREFGWAWILTGFVVVECVVLAVNRGRCPLTDVAGRYTDERAANFDIYLPEWLARYNKVIFGSVFIAGELYVFWLWLVY